MRNVQDVAHMAGNSWTQKTQHQDQIKQRAGRSLQYKGLVDAFLAFVDWKGQESEGIDPKIPQEEDGTCISRMVSSTSLAAAGKNKEEKGKENGFQKDVQPGYECLASSHNAKNESDQSTQRKEQSPTVADADPCIPRLAFCAKPEQVPRSGNGTT